MINKHKLLVHKKRVINGKVVHTTHKITNGGKLEHVQTKRRMGKRHVGTGFMDLFKKAVGAIAPIAINALSGLAKDKIASVTGSGARSRADIVRNKLLKSMTKRGGCISQY